MEANIVNLFHLLSRWWNQPNTIVTLVRNVLVKAFKMGRR